MANPSPKPANSIHERESSQSILVKMKWAGQVCSKVKLVGIIVIWHSSLIVMLSPAAPTGQSDPWLWRAGRDGDRWLKAPPHASTSDHGELERMDATDASMHCLLAGSALMHDKAHFCTLRLASKLLCEGARQQTATSDYLTPAHLCGCLSSLTPASPPPHSPAKSPMLASLIRPSI